MIGSGGDFSRSVWLVLRCWGLSIDLCRFLHPRLLRHVREIELAELRIPIRLGMNQWGLNFPANSFYRRFEGRSIGHGFYLDRPFAINEQIPLNMHIFRNKVSSSLIGNVQLTNGFTNSIHVVHYDRHHLKQVWTCGIYQQTREYRESAKERLSGANFKSEWGNCLCHRKPDLEKWDSLPKDENYNRMLPPPKPKRRLWHWRDNKWVKQDMDAIERVQVVEPAVPTLWAKKLYNPNTK